MAIPLVYRQCIIFTLCADGGGRGERERGRESLCVCFPAPLDTDRVNNVGIKVCICVSRCFVDTNREGGCGKEEIGRWLRVNSIEMNEWRNVNFLDSKSWGNSRKSQNTGCYLFLFFFFVSNWKIVRNFDFRNSSFKLWLNRVVLYLNFKS